MPEPSRRITRISPNSLEGWESFFEALRRVREGQYILMLSIGDHDFTLEVSDGTFTTTDVVVVTVENTPPVAGPIGGGVYHLGPSTTFTLGGEVSDFDGEELSYEWRRGATVLGTGTITPPAGGEPRALPPLTVGTTEGEPLPPESALRCA